MAATTIPAIKAAIVKVLEASEDLEDVTVAKGKEPTRKTEWIWVQRAEAAREFRLIGQKPMPLDELVKVHLRVVAIRGDIEAAEKRATELFEAVEAALREDDKLGGAVLWHKIESFESEPLNFDTKVGFHYVPIVSAAARI